MKRADIKAGHVYGYNESRDFISHYTPVLVLSTDLYVIPRFGAYKLVLAGPQHTKMQGTPYRDQVGLLAVRLWSMDTVAVAKVTQQATTEAAVAGLNGECRDVLDPDDPDRRLATYFLLKNQRYLHGDYHELAAELDAAERQRDEHDAAREADRVARLGTYNALADRLTALGITGYHAADWENKSRFEGLTFDDMDALLLLAEDGALRSRFK
jgi:hypothetical protein